GWNNGERNNRMRATGVKKQGVRASEAPLGAARSPRRDPGPHHGVAGDAFLSDEESLVALEEEHADGLTAAQIVEAFTARRVHLSEATCGRGVQLGRPPRSGRVGRKGKHQGSLGIYPPSAIRRIATIKRLMMESLTIEDIARSLRFKDEVEALDRGLKELLR